MGAPLVSVAVVARLQCF